MVLGVSKMLRADKRLTSCLVREGDELFPNGIFEFNVTRILVEYGVYGK